MAAKRLHLLDLGRRSVCAGGQPSVIVLVLLAAAMVACGLFDDGLPSDETIHETVNQHVQPGATVNDIRAFVTKRKISGGTMSEAGRTARDVLLGLMKTCQKLGVCFFHYLGDRLGIPATPRIAPLPDLVRQAAKA